MRRFKYLFSVLVFFLTPALVLAEAPLPQEKENIRAIVKDAKGETLEGNLRLYPNEIIVSTTDDREKFIPLKMIESIKIEKIQGGIPGADPLGGESYYFVRMQNSQEIFTLKKKYTFSLNTIAGVVTKPIDPDMVRNSTRKESSSTAKTQSEQSLIRGEGVVLSLEIKF